MFPSKTKTFLTVIACFFSLFNFSISSAKDCKLLRTEVVNESGVTIIKDNSFLLGDSNLVLVNNTLLTEFLRNTKSSIVLYDKKNNSFFIDYFVKAINNSMTIAKLDISSNRTLNLANILNCDTDINKAINIPDNELRAIKKQNPKPVENGLSILAPNFFDSIHDENSDQVRIAKRYVFFANYEASAGNYEDAAINYKKALESYPMCYEALVGLAGVYYRTKSFAEAAGLLEQAIRINPLDSNLYIKLAIIFIESEDYESAYIILNKAKQLFPMDRSVMYHLGIAAYLNGDLKRLKKLCSTLSTLDLNKGKSLCNLID